MKIELDPNEKSYKFCRVKFRIKTKISIEDRLSGRQKVTATRTITTSRRSETQPVTKIVSPPPDKLNAQQVAALTDLIQTNPSNQIWQNAIEQNKKTIS